VHDALTMGASEGVGDLRAEADGLSGGNRAALQPPMERLAFDVLHHQEIDAVLMPDVVQRADVRMIQLRDRARLSVEPLPRLGVLKKMRTQDPEWDLFRQRCGSLGRVRERLHVVNGETVLAAGGFQDRPAPDLLESVNLRDVRVIERGEQLRFTTEAADAASMCGESAGENLQRNVATEPCIARAIDLAHSAGADRPNDLVNTNPCSAREAHAD
jgi:hypothetical protein